MIHGDDLKRIGFRPQWGGIELTPVGKRAVKVISIAQLSEIRIANLVRPKRSYPVVNAYRVAAGAWALLMISLAIYELRNW